MNPQRFRTGVDGIDEILHGGLLATGVYIVQGVPGTGKTVLANQICFNEAARGGRAVYVTLLAEAHSRLMQHQSTMSFFRSDAIPEQVTYISAFEAMRAEGLAGVMRLLRSEMRQKDATLLVLDGLVGLPPANGSAEAHEVRLFVSEVQSHATMHECTTLLLTSMSAPEQSTAEQPIVDGIIVLRKTAYGARRERSIEFWKSRGIGAIAGTHAFSISDAGVTVFPRIEAARTAVEEGLEDEQPPLASGVIGFDAIVEPAGIPGSTVTAIVGLPGTGKTTFGLHFLAGASRSEPALHFGFFESPRRLIAAGERLGLPLRALADSGTLRFSWQPYGQGILDELAYRLLAEVRAHRARRVFVDGLGGFMATPTYAERESAFLGTLARQLRELGATVILTAGIPDRRGSGMTLPNEGISAFADNLLVLKSAEVRGQVRRLLTIEKMCSARYDPRIHELVLDNRGLRVEHSGAVHAQPTGAGP